MNANDILKLVNAGFTKDDIMGLMKAPEAPDPVTITEVNPVPKDQVASTPPQEAPAEVASPSSAEVPEAIAKALENINGTLAKLQLFASRTDGQPAQSKDSFIDILSSTYNRKE